MSEDRSKYLKIAGLAFALVTLLVLVFAVGMCREGGSPQNDEAFDRGDDDVTHVVPQRSHAGRAPAA